MPDRRERPINTIKEFCKNVRKESWLYRYSLLLQADRANG